MHQKFWPFLLLLVSLLLLLTETMIPSAGILGILSALALVAAIVTAFLNLGMVAGTIFLVACVALTPFVFSLIVHYWPKTPIGKRILIKPPNARDLQPLHLQSLKELVGRTGTAISPMLPAGAVKIDGKVVDAVSEGLPIERGTSIEVITVDGNHLVVRPTTKSVRPAPKSPDDVLSQPVESIVADPFDEPLA